MECINLAEALVREISDYGRTRSPLLWPMAQQNWNQNRRMLDRGFDKSHVIVVVAVLLIRYIWSILERSNADLTAIPTQAQQIIWIQLWASSALLVNTFLALVVVLILGPLRARFAKRRQAASKPISHCPDTNTLQYVYEILFVLMFTL